jgi:hypothetical protein
MLLFSSFNLSSKPWVNSSIHANATLRLGGPSFSHFSRKKTPVRSGFYPPYMGVIVPWPWGSKYAPGKRSITS